jgi:hypothetical protein
MAFATIKSIIQHKYAVFLHAIKTPMKKMNNASVSPNV